MISRIIIFPLSALLLSSCGNLDGKLSLSRPARGILPPSNKITLSIEDTSVVLSEGGAATLAVILSEKRSVPTVVNVSLYSARGDELDDFLPLSSTLTIPAHRVSWPVAISVVDDLLVEGTETFELRIGSSDPVLEVVTDHVAITVSDDDTLGAFNISGITSGADAVTDANLNGSLYPTVNWNGSSGAASYDITVYTADGSTVICSTQNTTSSSYNFSSCSLTANNSYKVKVVAKNSNGNVTLAAANDMFDFYVNTAPVPVNDGPYLVMASEGVVSLNVLTDNLVTGASDPDADPDGQDLTVIAVSSGTKGTSAFTASTVTFDPTATESGVETLTYTVSDGKGATATATLTIHIMTPYTWTGAVSASWSNQSNWCGALNAIRTTCVGSSSLPSAADLVVFDNTCATNCSPTIDTAVDVLGMRLSPGYLGTVAQNSGQTIAVGADGYVQGGGSFLGSDADITFAKFTLNSGIFRSTSTDFSVGYILPANAHAYDGFTVGATGSFVHNSGRLIFNGTVRGQCASSVAITVTLDANVELFDLEVSMNQDQQCSESTNDNSILPLNGTGRFVVLNNLYFKDGLINNGTIELRGDLHLSCAAPGFGGECAMGGSTWILMNGSSDQFIRGGSHSGPQAPRIAVNTSHAVTSDTPDVWLSALDIQSGTFLAPTGTLRIAKEVRTSHQTDTFRLGSAASFLHNSGTVEFGNYGGHGGSQINADAEINFYNMTVNIQKTVGYDGSIRAQGSQQVHVLNSLRFIEGRFYNGALYAHGDVVLECSVPGDVCTAGGNGTLYFEGSGSQLFQVDPGAILMNRIRVRKTNPADKVTFSSSAVVPIDLHINVGTVDLSTWDLSIGNLLLVDPDGTLSCDSGGGGSVTYGSITNNGTLACP